MQTLNAHPDVAHTNPGNSLPRVARRALDGWALAALDGKHDYPTPFAALCAVFAHAQARGWDLPELWDRAEKLARAQAQQDKRAPNYRRIGRTLGNAWKRAQQGRTEGNPFTVRRGVQAARAQAEAARWNGRAGTSRVLTLLAVLDAADAQRTITPSLAVRSLSQATGLGLGTVHRALKALTAEGWLREVTKAEGDRASTYRVLRTSEDMARSGTQGLTPGGTEGLFHLVPPQDLAALDAFAPAALGRTAARVLAALDALDTRTPRAVAERTGLNVATVRRALCALEAVGIAQRHRAGRGYVWTARLEVLTATAERIAADYGTKGRADRRAATYAAQRERWGTFVRQREKALAQARSHYRPGHFARAA